jgi:hypothetical protein
MKFLFASVQLRVTAFVMADGSPVAPIARGYLPRLTFSAVFPFPKTTYPTLTRAWTI